MLLIWSLSRLYQLLPLPALADKTLQRRFWEGMTRAEVWDFCSVWLFCVFLSCLRWWQRWRTKCALTATLRWALGGDLSLLCSALLSLCVLWAPPKWTHCRAGTQGWVQDHLGLAPCKQQCRAQVMQLGSGEHVTVQLCKWGPKSLFSAEMPEDEGRSSVQPWFKQGVPAWPHGDGQGEGGTGGQNKAWMVAPVFTAVSFPFQVENTKLEEGKKKNQQKKKKRMETKVSKLRRSVLIAYERLHPKSYPIDVVVLFFWQPVCYVFFFKYSCTEI